jgi:translation initiation factor IF-3
MIQQKHFKNKQIRTTYCKLIGADNKLVGENILVREALSQAQEQGLDLVELSPGVCKIMNYGKYCYEQKKHNSGKEAGANNSDVLKEITVGVNTAEYDLQRFAKKISELLEDNFKVQVKVKFTGRQMGNPELGQNQLSKLLEFLTIKEYVVQKPSMSGKYLITFLTVK